MPDSKKALRLENWIDSLQFDSIADLSLKIRPLSSGVGFLKLKDESGEASSSNPVISLLKSLPPHAEYDLDSRHFDLGDLNSEKTVAVAKMLVGKKQTLVGLFESSSSSLSMEAAYSEQLNSGSGRKAPLLLNFVSSLRMNEVSQFAKLRSSAPVEVVHIGPQYHCSERQSIEELLRQGDKIIFLSQIQKQGLLTSINRTTQADEQRPLWLRINLNSLAASHGGDRESWATGIQLQELIESVELLNRQCFIYGLSLGPIAGVEAQDLTARSAAQLLSFFVYVQSYRHVVSEFHGRKS